MLFASALVVLNLTAHLVSGLAVTCVCQAYRAKIRLQEAVVQQQEKRIIECVLRVPRN